MCDPRVQWLAARYIERAAVHRRQRFDGSAVLALAVTILVALFAPLPFPMRLIVLVANAIALGLLVDRLDGTRAACDRYDARWNGADPGMPPRTVRS
jgi:hypothetical protein